MVHCTCSSCFSSLDVISISRLFWIDPSIINTYSMQCRGGPEPIPADLERDSRLGMSLTVFLPHFYFPFWPLFAEWGWFLVLTASNKLLHWTCSACCVCLLGPNFSGSTLVLWLMFCFVLFLFHIPSSSCCFLLLTTYCLTFRPHPCQVSHHVRFPSLPSCVAPVSDCLQPCQVYKHSLVPVSALVPTQAQIHATP